MIKCWSWIAKVDRISQANKYYLPMVLVSNESVEITQTSICFGRLHPFLSCSHGFAAPSVLSSYPKK